MKNYRLVARLRRHGFPRLAAPARRPDRPGRPRGGGPQGHPEEDRRPRRRTDRRRRPRPRAGGQLPRRLQAHRRGPLPRPQRRPARKTSASSPSRRRRRGSTPEDPPARSSTATASSTRPQPSPLDRRYVLHWPYPLKLGAMREAARLFVRTADFTAFSSNRDRSPVRTVTRSELRRIGRRDRLHDRGPGLPALHGQDDRRDAPRGRPGPDPPGRYRGDLPATRTGRSPGRRPRPRA